MTRSGSGSYGAISINGNAMTLTHTQSTADASHMFSVNSAGNLMLSTTDGNPYALSGGMLTCEGYGISGTTVEYRYDAGGLRVEKIVDGVSTHYTLHGKLLTHLTKGMDKMHFFYDAQSKPAMVDFNGMLYTYVHNLQGDIVAIVDSTGEKVVEYKYDAWGKPTAVENRIHETDSTLTNEYAMLANLNPFRYRGYVWDPETGLYYLRSRYYDPVWGRFLNADSLMQKGKIFTHNIYAYCKNSPTSRIDPYGKSDEPCWWTWLKKNVIKPLIKVKVVEIQLEKIAIQTALSATGVKGTIGLTVGGSAFAGGTAVVSGGIVADTQGKIGMAVTSGGGASLSAPGVSASASISVTNAPSLDRLNGLATNIGSSIGIVGLEYSAFGNDKDAQTYSGYTLSTGVSTSAIPFEGHVTETYSLVFDIDAFKATDVLCELLLYLAE